MPESTPASLPLCWNKCLTLVHGHNHVHQRPDNAPAVVHAELDLTRKVTGLGRLEEQYKSVKGAQESCGEQRELRESEEQGYIRFRHTPGYNHGVDQGTYQSGLGLEFQA